MILDYSLSPPSYISDADHKEKISKFVAKWILLMTLQKMKTTKPCIEKLVFPENQEF